MTSAAVLLMTCNVLAKVQKKKIPCTIYFRTEQVRSIKMRKKTGRGHFSRLRRYFQCTSKLLLYLGFIAFFLARKNTLFLSFFAKKPMRKICEKSTLFCHQFSSNWLYIFVLYVTKKMFPCHLMGKIGQFNHVLPSFLDVDLKVV